MPSDTEQGKQPCLHNHANTGVVRGPCEVRDHLATDRDWQPPASAYRLMQEEALLCFVRQGDGPWRLPDDG
jgi:hypothetical protein